MVEYLEKKHTPLNILEVGCGNGWLAAKLADIPLVKVTGVDINRAEVNQASRVFKKGNLQFVCDSFNEDTFGEQFDIIIFAAVLPYFPSVKDILKTALNKLSPGVRDPYCGYSFLQAKRSIKGPKTLY